MLERSGEVVKSKGQTQRKKNGFPKIDQGTLKKQSIAIDLAVGKDPSRFEGQKVSGGRFEIFDFSTIFFRKSKISDFLIFH